MIDDWGRDWTCNQARLSSTNADPMLRPIEIDADIENVETMIRAWVAKQPAWKIVSDPPLARDSANDSARDHASDPMRRLHLTRTTAVFRFVDDIYIEITPIAPAVDGSPRCGIDAESQSRVGKGDLGQNPRNLKELRKGILGD